MTGGKDFNVDDPKEAYTKLTVMAEELRRRSPELRLTESGAFARVFGDPANAVLARAATRRPTPSALVVG